MGRLRNEQKESIHKAFRETGTIRGTKKITGIGRKAIRRELDRVANPVPNATKGTVRKSKLDPYKAKIGYLVSEKGLSAVRILEEINELGYDGGYSILKNYVRVIRPRNKKRPRPPIDHPPGYEAQMDWSPHKVIIGGKEQIVHTGSIVLCYSRWIFMRHFTDETLESVISLHEQAFQELGAIPEIITYDNMTTVGRHVGPGKVWINPRFERFSKEYGFEIVILPPGAKERHGKVERPFHYIENNFLAGREFDDMEDLNNRADQWRWNKANVRIHGTVKQKPVDRLEREMPYLKRLPINSADVNYKEVDRKINIDFCVVINNKRYSVNPDLIGEKAKVRLYQDHLEIWVNNELHCKHMYCGKDRNVLPEHENIYKKMTGQKRLLEETFIRLGEPANKFYEGLQQTRKAAAGYHLQRILKYADRYGSDVVVGALAYASKHGAYSAESVLQVITGKKLKKQKSMDRVPDNVRQYLEAYAVEKESLEHYDQIIQNEEEIK
ncbi:MAG: IS21 family transposase [Candidatus Magnetomorum sp.]|nr:IS21 family transposase [Candidatus Magnetomorum sp.]